MADDYTNLISSSYSSGSIHFTGLGSGTDFDSMITQLMEVETKSLSNMADNYKAWETKISAVQELNTTALSLKTALAGMDTPTEFMVKSSTSSDPASLTATAGVDAESGSHAIEINQLAQNNILMSAQGFASESASVNETGSDETFEYTYNGKTISQTISSGTSLNALVKMINDDPDNPGIKAAIINDGTTDGYHLQLRGMDQGADYDVAVSTTTTLTSLTSGFDETQAAQNARIKVDGWPLDGTYIERSSNAIDDVITGLTLNLKQTTGSGETITVSTDTDTAAIKEKITGFVDQVNEVLAKIRSLTKIDTSDNSSSLFTGSYTIESMASSIKSVLTSRGIGFDPNDDPISTLVGNQIFGSDALSIGLTTDTTEGSATFGLLVLDEASLDKALEEDPEAVMEIFSANQIPEVNTSAFSYLSSISGTTQSGIYDISYTVTGGEITSATIDGTTYNYAGGSSGKSGNTLTSLNGPSKGLAITVNDLTDGTHEGTLRLKEGKTSELSTLLDQITNSSSGSLSILEDSYQETIESLEDKMTKEQERLQEYERDLRDRFARLESTLGYYSNIQEMLTTQLKQLSSSD